MYNKFTQLQPQRSQFFCDGLPQRGPSNIALNCQCGMILHRKGDLTRHLSYCVSESFNPDGCGLTVNFVHVCIPNTRTTVLQVPLTVL